jgi:hypothetical protein
VRDRARGQPQCHLAEPAHPRLKNAGHDSHRASEPHNNRRLRRSEPRARDHRPYAARAPPAPKARALPGYATPRLFEHGYRTCLRFLAVVTGLHRSDQYAAYVWDPSLCERAMPPITGHHDHDTATAELDDPAAITREHVEASISRRSSSRMRISKDTRGSTGVASKAGLVMSASDAVTNRSIRRMDSPATADLAHRGAHALRSRHWPRTEPRESRSTDGQNPSVLESSRPPGACVEPPGSARCSRPIRSCSDSPSPSQPNDGLVTAPWSIR